MQMEGLLQFRSQEREAPRDYVTRESHYYLGKRYLLKVIEHNAAPKVAIKHETIEMYIRPNTGIEKRRELLDEWYRQRLKEIIPAIEAGKTVICDRYRLSTLMYGMALGLEEEWLEEMNGQFPGPDEMILLIPSFETCQKRLGERSTRDIMETDSLQKRVYDNYVAYGKRHPDFAVLDTGKTPDVTLQEILDVLG